MKKLNNNLYKTDEVSNFRDLIDNTVKKHPDNIAYKFKKNVNKKDEIIVEKTYKEIKKEIENLGTALLNLGLENKKVALIGNNRYEWCVSYLAITTSNIVVVPLDKALPDAEIKTLIKRSNVDAVIYENKYNNVFEQIKNEKSEKVSYFINMDLENNENGVLSLKKLIKNGEEQLKNGDTKYEKIETDNEKMSVLIFTSGTTNQPKGVMLSQKNITSSIMSCSRLVKLYPTDILLSFLPLHHTFECTITFLYGFYSGSTIAFCDGLKYIAKNLVDYKITVFVAVPLILETIYKKIQKGIKDQGKEKTFNTITKLSNFLLKFHIDIRRKVFKSVLNQLGGNLRITFFGAAPMNKEVIKGYNNLGIKTIQGYGLTETSPLLSAETDKNQFPGSVGIQPYNVELKIENPNEQGIGEIIAKGPNIMLGYYENEEATNEVIKDGWFHTGDLGYFNKEGYLFITGRMKEVIVLKNGENVFPADIEFLINKLQYVKESIVFPRENSKGEISLGVKIVYDEEIIKSYFENKSSEYKDLVWEDIKEINKELSVFKRIKEIILTTEELEKTTTQKVKRFKEIQKILGK